MTENAWTLVLEHLRQTIEPEEYRRWFAASAQASDSGDLITIWVPAATDARHISVHYLDSILHFLEQQGRPGLMLRFLPTGYGDEPEEA